MLTKSRMPAHLSIGSRITASRGLNVSFQCNARITGRYVRPTATVTPEFQDRLHASPAV